MAQLELPWNENRWETDLRNTVNTKSWLWNMLLWNSHLIIILPAEHIAAHKERHSVGSLHTLRHEIPASQLRVALLPVEYTVVYRRILNLNYRNLWFSSYLPIPSHLPIHKLRTTTRPGHRIKRNKEHSWNWTRKQVTLRTNLLLGCSVNMSGLQFFTRFSIVSSAVRTPSFIPVRSFTVSGIEPITLRMPRITEMRNITEKRSVVQVYNSQLIIDHFTHHNDSTV